MNYEMSPARREANRLNARKSTGPKSDAGKQTSSLNALRHGLTAQVIVLPAADLAAYQRFIQSFHDDCRPKGALEVQLTQSLADDAWRLNRSKAIENNIFTLGLTEKFDGILTENEQVRDALALAAALRQETRSLSSLSLHQQRVARQFERNVNQLRELQAERRRREAAEMRDAVMLYETHCEQLEAESAAGLNPAGLANPAPSPPYDPAKDGFVFTNAEIEAHLSRRHRLDEAYGFPYNRSAAA